MSSQLLSVSALNHQIKALMEATFLGISVVGEVSNITYHSSGHLYFSIKDESSSIRCVMFKAQASRLKFRIENGLKVIITGAITLYVPRGEYQIQCHNVEPDGAGSLALAFEQLKVKLDALGYFDEKTKKQLPHYPKKIGIATSATSAALQDMIRVATTRWPMVKLVIANTVVQGELGKDSIIHSLKKLDALGCDVIVVGRGGGSIEDLWCFNEEDVAHAIHTASTPIVSAVGHETDWVISDFVADRRAPTPSAAMEMILPDCRDASMTVDDLGSTLTSRYLQLLGRFRLVATSLQESLLHFNPLSKLSLQARELHDLEKSLALSFTRSLNNKSENLSPLKELLSQSMLHRLKDKQSALQWLSEQYNLADPVVSFRPKSAIVHKEGKRVALSELEIGDTIVLEDLDTKMTAKVCDKRLIDDIK